MAVSLREPGAGTFLPLAASSRSGERQRKIERKRESERDTAKDKAKERERKIERKREIETNALLYGSPSFKIIVGL